MLIKHTLAPCLGWSVGVLAAGVWLLSGGLTVAGMALHTLTPPVPRGVSRLWTDQMIWLLTGATLTGLAYLVTSIVRIALDGRWLQSLGPTAGTIDDRASLQLDTAQSEQLVERARRVEGLAHQLASTTERAQTQIDAVYTPLDEIFDAATNLGVNGQDEYGTS